ncbi:MAG: hypothetical protein H7239_01295 [Flavobacterium sp.]|nr:hypothetical protein [Flavobacterium sp.]
MINSIKIITSEITENLNFSFVNKAKCIFNFEQLNLDYGNSFTFEINFDLTILEYRNHDYNWVSTKSNYVANQFCPKILKLQNGFFVQSNITDGIWEIDKNNNKQLLWKFNPQHANPITNYQGINNTKSVESAIQKFRFQQFPVLLFSLKNAVEFSRSIHPFSAVAVFTDHCDFDTALNLKLQREFFKEHGIKITKGFFLNHFSKRDDNASFQNDYKELLKWQKEAHELCYHSLSQSIKSVDESLDDFYTLNPPLSNIKTWIDHGYQPYNLSLYKNNNIENKVFESNLINKNIKILWNYIDSGTATVGVINQLNPQQFSLSSFYNGSSNESFITRIQLLIKNIVFHHYGNEVIINRYKKTSTHFKKLIYNKNISSFFTFSKNFVLISFSIIKVLLFWSRHKNIPFKLAKFSPLVFKHTISENDFYIFQTLEMLDFKKSLKKENIDLLILENGVFIAHTYFSVPLKYHRGKLFKSETSIDSEVKHNFTYLGQKIKNNEIWNPTLSELIDYWSKFEKIILDVNQVGEIVIKNNEDLVFRIIN